MRNPVLHGKKQWGCGGGGGGGERTLGLFVKSFLPVFREKQHRNIFSNHTGRLAKFGWILTYLKISVEMAVTWFLPGAIQFSCGEFCMNAHQSSCAPFAACSLAS